MASLFIFNFFSPLLETDKTFAHHFRIEIDIQNHQRNVPFTFASTGDINPPCTAPDSVANR